MFGQGGTIEPNMLYSNTKIENLTPGLLDKFKKILSVGEVLEDSLSDDISNQIYIILNEGQDDDSARMIVTYPMI